MKLFWFAPLKFLDGLVDRIVAIGGALIIGQFPQFYGEYVQRLGGHLEEARDQLLQYSQAAVAHKITLQDYILIHLQSGNSIFVNTGRIIKSLVERFEFLEKAYYQFKNGPELFRGWIFIRHLDPKIVMETWLDYTPGIPISKEGIIYALLGMILFWGVYYGFKSIVRVIFLKISKRIKNSSPKSLDNC